MYRIEINPDDPQSIERALRTEWLLTNGLGGYAMGTALGVNTRRYHGLLIAATKPPVGRILALHSIVEEMQVNGQTFNLAVQQFGPGEILHPRGFRWLRECRVDLPDSVSWRFDVDGLTITKKIAFTGVRNSIRVHYQIRGSQVQALMRLRPITGLRDFHALGTREPRMLPTPECCDDYLEFEYGAGNLFLGREGGQWQLDPQWWRQYCYSSDRIRGQDYQEDLWSPGVVTAQLEDEGEVSLHAGQGAPRRGEQPLGIEGPRRHRLARAAASSSELHRLHCAAEQFVVERDFDDSSAPSIIAGYPWFSDWGRDSMISAPGLLLCTMRLDEAREFLLLYARHLRNGLIPNTFDERTGEPHFNTVDASLWFIHAVHELWQSEMSRDREGAASRLMRGPNRPLPDGRGSYEVLIDACRAIINAYRKGTDFNIHMEPDGLIAAGDESTQLTWMDAKRDGVTFSPRNGKAVEINALWIHALHCVAELSNDKAERDELNRLSRQAADSFREQFWWAERQCLHDVLTPRDGRWIADGKLRPNQIFAVSLAPSPLDESQQRAVVQTVRERLLTPYGLRTLNRDDPNYRGRYEGDLFQRDAAYHNGTVWPWLIGPFCEALLRIENFSGAAKRDVRQIIQSLLDSMQGPDAGGKCVGQISEVYDGDPPHRPDGCPAQAWSVAEVLRIMSMLDV